MARKDLIVYIAGDNSDLKKKLDQVKKDLSQFGKDLTAIGKTLTLGLTAPLLAGFAAAVKVAADFEQQMSDVAAKTGAVGKEFNDLKNLAIELGAKTAFSARQAAEAMSALAQAGFTTKEIMAAMPGLLNLAAAGSVELSQAAAITAAALRGFGLEASESARVADVLAKAAITSMADVTSLGEALKFVAPVAKSLGVSLEETVAMIGKLSDVGLDATMAGRSLRSAMLSLLDPTKEARDTFERLNVAWKNADGSARPFLDIMKALGAAQATAADMAKIFATETITAALVLKDSVGAVGEYSESLKEIGVAERVASEKLNNLKGSIEELKGSLESLAIAFADAGLIGVLKSLADTATGVVNVLSKTSPELLKIGTGFAILLAAIGPVVWSLGQFSLAITTILGMKGPLLAMFGGLAGQLVKIPGMLASVGAAFTRARIAVTAFVVSLTAGGIGGAFRALDTLMLAATASLANFGRALVLFSGSYAVTAVAALGKLRNGFVALGMAIMSGNIVAGLAIIKAGLIAFATTMATVVAPAIAAVAVAWTLWEVKRWMDANKALGESTSQLETALQNLAEHLAKQGILVERGNLSLEAWRVALFAAAKANREAAGGAEALEAAARRAAVGAIDLAAALDILKDKGKDKLDALNAALKILEKGLKEGTVSQARFNEALKVYQEASGKAAGKTKELKDSVAELIAKGELGVSTLTALELTMLAYKAAVEKGKDAWKALSAELTEGNRTLKEQKQALDEAVQGWYKINPELAEAVAKATALKPALAGVNVEALKAAASGKEFSEAFNVDVANLEKVKAQITWISEQLKNQNLTLEQRAILQNQLNSLTDQYNNTLGIQEKQGGRIAEMWVKIEQAVRTFGSSLYDVMKGAQTLGQAFMAMLDDIARTIVETVVQGAIDVMKDSILEAVKATDLLSEGWKKFFGIVGAPTGGSPSPGVPGAPGGAQGGAAGGLTGVISMITGIANLLLGIFQSFQFAAMNKTLDLIEREVRESKIHLGFILEAMHTYMGENQWQRHEAIKEFWTQQLEKMSALIDAVKAIAVNVNVSAVPGAPTGVPTVQVMFVEWADATKDYFSKELQRIADALWAQLDAIRARLDIIDLNVYRQWFGPELEKISGILTGIYLQLDAMGGGQPVGEWIPNATMGGAAAPAMNFTFNGSMRQGEVLERVQREMEAYGIPH